MLVSQLKFTMGEVEGRMQSNLLKATLELGNNRGPCPLPHLPSAAWLPPVICIYSLLLLLEGRTTPYYLQSLSPKPSSSRATRARLIPSGPGRVGRKVTRDRAGLRIKGHL